MVQSGDDCNKLSTTNSVSTGALRVLNGLFPDCTNLIAGATLCLPQSCSIYNVQPGDTCSGITGTTGVGLSDLTSYNPTLNSDCSNLNAGENLCLSPPAGNYTPTPIAGATATHTGSFATATVAPKGKKAAGSTDKCGKWYEVQVSRPLLLLTSMSHTS